MLAELNQALVFACIFEDAAGAGVSPATATYTLKRPDGTVFTGSPVADGELVGLHTVELAAGLVNVAGLYVCRFETGDAGVKAVNKWSVYLVGKPWVETAANITNGVGLTAAERQKIMQMIWPSGVVRFVLPGGNNANDGLTWGTAKRDLANAILGASAGDTIIMGPGTHTLPDGSQVIAASIRLQGCGPATVLRYQGAPVNGVLDLTAAVEVSDLSFDVDLAGMGVTDPAVIRSASHCRVRRVTIDGVDTTGSTSFTGIQAASGATDVVRDDCSIAVSGATTNVETAGVASLDPDNAGIAAVKAKTDALPASPAASGDIPAADIAAIKAKTDALPAHPAAKEDVVGGTPVNVRMTGNSYRLR